jgi:deoxyribodipyrimidine photo-lyase
MVPAREVSQKAEIGARTLRPKFWKAFVEPEGIPAETLPTDFPPYSGKSPEAVADAVSNARCDRLVRPVEGAFCSQSLGRRALSEFVGSRLSRYAPFRNDPNSEASSGLSFQFRNGTLSPEEVVLAVRRSGVSNENVQAFLEEFLIRRELSENFCLYRGEDYDSLESAPAWALATLRKHASDAREYRYSFGEFESAATHDNLWNACQNELVTSGKIASYLRMYWAKKILEWSPSPEEAYKTAMTLNDRYALDGRSPNGYV